MRTCLRSRLSGTKLAQPGRVPGSRLALVVSILLLALVLVFFFNPAVVPSSMAQGPTAIGPVVGPKIFATSLDQNMRALSHGGVRNLRELVPAARRTSFARPPVTDNARQARRGTAVMPAPLANFEGLDFSNWGSGWPPDPVGDVGRNHYVQAINIAFGVFDKTGALLAATTFDDFFQGTGTPCDYGNEGDPIVVYDAQADRWIVSDIAWSSATGPFYECIGVSKTSDPVSGGWWQYALLTDPRYLGDYPKTAVWSDGYYLSANMYDIVSQNLVGARVWGLERQAMLSGAPVTSVAFDLPCGAPCYSSLLPANLRGALPPAGTPEFLASIDEPNLLHLWKLKTDWTAPGNSTFTGPIEITVSPFVMPCAAAAIFDCVPQKEGERVDALGDRLMMQLQYRNLSGIESLWANHTVVSSSAVGQPTGIRWYEIRDPNASPTVRQQGTYQPDSNYRWMGSLAVDKSGNMALGYSVSSSAMYPSIRYAGRLATDPLGILSQDETVLINGTGSQQGAFSRWGDYSAMSVDPTDDCTFWYTNEYYVTTGRLWHTRIGSFRFPSCGAPPSTPTPVTTPTMPVNNIVQVLPTQTPVVRCQDPLEPDNSASLAHTITGPELHNFHVPGDEDWVKFTAIAHWVYWIKADPPGNFPTEPRLEVLVDGSVVAANDHAFGNVAETWWWNNGPDRTAYVRVSELKERGECGNTQYTLSVRGYKDRP